MLRTATTITALSGAPVVPFTLPRNAGIMPSLAWASSRLRLGLRRGGCVKRFNIRDQPIVNSNFQGAIGSNWAKP